MFNFSRGRGRPLFDIEALYGFDDFRIERRDDGAISFRGNFTDPHGTARTSRRFVEVSLDARGEWRGKNGIRYLEARTAWRALTDANGRLTAIAFAQHAISWASQQANDQLAGLRDAHIAIGNSI